MGNLAFIPAFKAHVGDWDYYICSMKYAQVAREIQFAHELGGNRDLNTLIQRGLSKRTEQILQYLLVSKHRFLGAMIVATWGGSPEYLPLEMDDPEGLLKGVDSGFGVLKLDGSHQFFALDGQHRLKAIKDAVQRKPALGSEDICVLLVPHYDTPDGRERTQRLFTNINRHAKPTTQAENIALDVDDGFAILTRRLVTEHSFLSQPGRVRVFSRPPSEGSFTLAGSSIPLTDQSAWTTITVLYDLLKELSFGLSKDLRNLQVKPSDEVLERSFEVLSKRIDELLAHCGNLCELLSHTPNARDLRAPKPNVGLGHPLMRPIVQKAVARAVNFLIEQRRTTWAESLERLKTLPWELGQAPWIAVFNTQNKKMITAKENGDLLEELLRIHLGPSDKAEIARARRHFREIRGVTYPISEDQLAKGIQLKRR